MDCGDFGSNKSKSEILKVEYLLKGVSLLKYDAINLAEKELQYGRDFLSKMQTSYNLPFVSANVYDSKTDKLFAKPYVIKQAGELKFGIFGVTIARLSDIRDHFKRVQPGRQKSTTTQTNGQTRTDFLPVTEQTCLRCHTKDNSPHFEYEKYLAKVKH